MDWGLVIRVDAIPQLLAALGMLGLAVALLRLNFSHAANRGFALFLLLRGLTIVTATYREIAAKTADASAVAAYWAGVFPYFLIPVPFLLLYFACVYPRPRWWFGTSRWGFVSILAVIGVLELFYAQDHTVWASFASGPEGQLLTVDQGPLFPLLGAMYLAFGVVALIFARDYTREPRGPRRRALLLVCLGFTLNALFDTVGAVVVLAFPDRFTAPVDLRLYLTALGLLPTLAGIALLARHGSRAKDAETRKSVSRSLAIMPLPAITAVLATFLIGTIEFPFLVATGIWRLLFPSLVTYALVRHQLFDIDLKIKWTVKQGTVGAVFVAVFFAVSEGAQQVFSTGIGPYMGILATALLLFALAPLQHLAERIATAAVPTARPMSDLSDEERRRLYADQVRLVWEDGLITKKERALLDHLRERLGLTHADAAHIEIEAIRA